jgi:hypothetical protein
MHFPADVHIGDLLQCFHRIGARTGPDWSTNNVIAERLVQFPTEEQHDTSPVSGRDSVYLPSGVCAGLTSSSGDRVSPGISLRRSL